MPFPVQKWPVFTLKPMPSELRMDDTELFIGLSSQFLYCRGTLHVYLTLKPGI